MKLLKTLIVFFSILVAPAFAQDFPNRPIKLVVSFPAGGGADFYGRLLAQKMGDILKQPVMVDNRAGANGHIGADYVAKSSPDGYTLLLGGANLAMAPAIYAKLPYDVKKDFAPVSMLARMQNVVVVPQNSKYKTLRDLLDAAKKEPGKLNYASSGLGGSPHLTMELMQSLTKVDIANVIYRGDQPAFLALLGGEIDVYFASMPGALPLIKGEKLRALAVSSKTRSPVLPNVPTVEEAGVPGFDFVSWYSVLAPANTPAAVIKKLNAAVVQLAGDPEVRAKFGDSGSEATSSTPEALQKIILDDIGTYSRIAKAAKLEPQ